MSTETPDSGDIILEPGTTAAARASGDGGSTTLIGVPIWQRRRPEILFRDADGNDVVSIGQGGLVAVRGVGEGTQILDHLDVDLYDTFREWLIAGGMVLPYSEDHVAFSAGAAGKVVGADNTALPGKNGTLTVWFAAAAVAGSPAMECLRIDPDGTLYAFGELATPEGVVKGLRMFLGMAT